MKTTFGAIILIFFLSGIVSAGELYVCDDESGNKVITTIPQSGMKNCSRKETYRDLSEHELEEIRMERERMRAAAHASSRSSLSKSANKQKESVKCEKEVLSKRYLGNNQYSNYNGICVLQTTCRSGGKVVSVQTSHWMPCVD